MLVDEEAVGQLGNKKVATVNFAQPPTITITTTITTIITTSTSTIIPTLSYLKVKEIYEV